MRKFLSKLFRFSLYGLVPLAILGVVYVSLDPFKVIKHYDSFYDMDAKGWVGLNKDFVSTSTFIHNSKTINYNSFIFGNSRSLFYEVSDWETHLPENSTCFHYDASAESIWALQKKIEFIDREGIKIENALLVLDYSILIQDTAMSGHLFVISPKLVGNSNIIEFHKTFFSAFLSPKFLYAYLDYQISGEVKPYMKENKLLDDAPYNYEIATNEIRHEYFEKLIAEKQYFTQERLSVFYQRDTIQKTSPQAIEENQRKILNEIHAILKRQNSNVKIVISPLYDQLKLNGKDLAYLKYLFGEENVFDFSGINNITIDYQNYYENSHYRPHIAREIMDEVYGE